MSARCYCPMSKKFFPVDRSLIGKQVGCPVCRESHDVVPGAVEGADNLSPSLSASIKPTVKQATFWNRFFAWTVDMIIMIMVSSIFLILFKQLYPDWSYSLSRFPEQMNIYIGFFLILLIVEIIPTYYLGQSIGKKALSIKVVRDKKTHNLFLVLLFRFLLKYTISIGTFLLGGLWIAFNNRRKSWHDFIVKTSVIKVTADPKKTIQWKSLLKKKPCLILASSFLVVTIFCVIAAFIGLGSEKTDWILKAEALRIQGKTTKSLTEYNSLIKTYPGFGKSYRMRGALHSEILGDLEKAIPDYETAIQLNSRDTEALEGVVRLYIAKAKLLGHDMSSNETQPVERHEPPSSPDSLVPADSIQQSDQLEKQLPEYIIVGTKSGSTRDDTAHQYSIQLKEPFDLGGKSREAVINDLRHKTQESILKSLKVDPNNDELRSIVQRINPDAKLPPKRPCFVATAACGNENAFEVKTLCRFRDDVLMHSNIGKQFVSFYYRKGSYPAQYISNSNLLRIITRAWLQPVVISAWIMLNYKSLLLISICLMALHFFYHQRYCGNTALRHFVLHMKNLDLIPFFLCCLY